MKTPTKLDLYKRHKTEYVATQKPGLVETKPAAYLAIEGRGAPGGDEFSACIGALYGVAFTIKMTRKFGGRKDYAIAKLEGQWWHPDRCDFAKAPKEEWCWKVCIRTPDFVTQGELDQAVVVLLKRRKPPQVKRVRLETWSEGTCVQMLHVGPYEREGETVALMKDFAARQGLVFRGRHHEIYLSDPRRVPPERLKTILRVPVRPAKA